ncbi:hypothetical protein I3760_01G105100 [Carya illinoinensis]|nr:hypothetical protein I3760_01G105100 [Carya illinoinensis]
MQIINGPISPADLGDLDLEQKMVPRASLTILFIALLISAELMAPSETRSTNMPTGVLPKTRYHGEYLGTRKIEGPGHGSPRAPSCVISPCHCPRPPC